MINAKKLYNTILNDSRITDIVKDVLDAYPETVEKFPCVIFLDDNQTDIEFADNLPLGDSIAVQIHIFTKALSGYATTSAIGLVVAEVMKEQFFTCRNNREVQDVADNVRHRVMYFTREVFS